MFTGFGSKNHKTFNVKPFFFVCLFSSDYHKKQNTLAALRKKALEKNPDEFYFKMISSQLQVRLAPSRESNKTSILIDKWPENTQWLTPCRSCRLISVVLMCVDFFCGVLTGWSSRSEKSQGGGGGDGGAEESDEDAGYQICGDEKGRGG